MQEPLASPAFFRRSKVLTEDTDDFIVGDRVWVNGVKPGYIQYIGETKFSPGMWAGIVLDEPTGKNDGTVNGSRYFYCEPNRGVFSRLYRLTRLPSSPDSRGLMESPDSGIARNSNSPPPKIALNGIMRNKSPCNGRNTSTTTLSDPYRQIPAKSPDLRFTSTTTFRSREKSPIRSSSSASSRESTKGVYFLSQKPSKTLTTTTTTTTTVDGPYKGGSLRVGDKVFVNASKGLMAGRLRYLGKTEFAPGHWAGVQLDEPEGKNDGSVAGKRYFVCPWRCGLFAPAYKVVKADPKRMTTVTRITRASPEI